MEIDGRQIVAWLAKASEPERQALIGATYSDSDSEWRIVELQPSNCWPGSIHLTPRPG